MGQQHSLELRGRDLVGLHLDQLLQPVDDRQVAVVVHDAEIASVQPALRVDRQSRRLLVSEIARHHVRAANPHLAELAGLDRSAARGIDERHFAVRNRRSDTSRPLPARRERNHVRHRARLCHPVALAEAGADALRAFLLELRAQRCRARHNHVDRREVVVVDDRVTCERENDRRDDERVRDPVLLNRAERAGEVETRHGDDRPALTQRIIEDDDEPVDVEERKDAERDFVLVGAEVRTELAEVRDDVPVRKHHALAHARRAARVRQRDDVLRRFDGNRRRLLVRLEQAGEGALAEHDDVFHVRARRRLARFLDERRNGEDEARGRIAQLEAQLVRCEQRIRRMDDAAE